MRWLVALLACIGLAQAQVIQHQISDDGYARVPLQFPFPYNGRVFTESYMFSNGVVGFLNPTNSWCCTGFDLTVNRGSPFDFAIMPLQTDLLNYNGRFLTEGTPQYQRYAWENISEFGAPQNLNTFGLEIRPSGFIGMYYEQINISPWRPVTIGMTGDTSQGQFTQYYHGSGFIEGAGRSYIYNADPCANNPLHSSTCPGYAEAYLAQQCSANPLYSPSCPYYADAYYAQQCTISPLYDRACPGYREAYALANVVPTTSTQTVSTTAPTLQVSTTGTITLTTPVVSDPVVNEVITRPVATSTTTTASRASEPVAQNTPAPAEKKAETKAETKQETKQVAKPQVKAPDGKTIEMPTIVQTPVKIEQVQLVDLLARQMVSKPMNTNPRAYYLMTLGGQRTHEDMIDEQFRKRD
jgi:hypothetical protein